MEPTPGVLRVQTGYESDIDNDDEFLAPPSATFDDPEERDHVREKFDMDIEDAMNFAKSLSAQRLEAGEKSIRQMDFVDGKKGDWNKLTWDGQTFLHILAYANFNRKSAPSLQWLMNRVMLRMPHLMGRLDKTNRSPLTVALATGNEAFSYAACYNLRDTTRQRFKEPLESECASLGGERDTTCLHTALTCNFNKEDLRQGIVKRICSFVPEQMFIVKDPRGRTPLHLAVEYERCCPGQHGVVEELLRYGPQALHVLIPVKLSLNSTHSVYQYHMETRRQFEAKGAAVEDHRRKQHQITIKNEDDYDSRTKKLPSKSEKNSMGPPALPRDRGDARMGVARSSTQSQDITSSASYTMGPSREDGNRSHTMNSIQDKSGQTISSSNATGSSRASANTSVARQEALNPAVVQREKERQVEGEAIGILLKMFYLRNQDPEKAAHSLKNVSGKSTKELWFDFGPPKRLTRTDFRKHFKHLRFDTVLQYVAFPNIELNEHKTTADPRFAGREDIVFFFEWLKQRGVTNIIKVIVDDLKSPSHSDEAIEKSLKPFKVEILDWRRLDLDPTSLSEIGGCLREVNLHWSGSNAVLRAWSEKDGLARIPTLEVINLFQTQGLESSVRTDRNLDAFESRLYESWPDETPKPKINRPKSGGGRLLIRGQSVDALPERHERPVDPHRWMQSMGNFSEQFRQLSCLRDKITDPALEPVEVALIDDGADITRGDLGNITGEKFPGKSFCYYQEGSTWRVSPYWDSSSGHGTLMARLIHKICPSAIIHVIKLQTFAVENSNSIQINPDSAIKAIEYAAERGSHIISLSWTIRPPEGEKKKEFDDAVHNAINNKGILMFCAASDQGKHADMTYPYRSNHDGFRIGAAKSTGGMAETVGDAHELDFIFPGHQVVVNENENIYDSDLQKFEAHSGSSVATALASGLAALIMECVRLGVFYTDKTKQGDPSMAIRKDDLVRIRKRNNMKAAMKSIGISQNTDGKYIEVWNWFDPIAEKLRLNDGSSIDQLEWIANLARHFLQKGLS
ncbi:intracellular serine [Fusarium heterosporum]|uniref:Intracellular serine n=1 Tax=Fusarium heterosporum TaxID=42747 RepID=A0A8H5TT03_FUSHE|nr:intracellular serine [Fusarium heterosporum]